MTRNLLPLLRNDIDILVTLDGDNHLLLQQISQVLLDQYSKTYKGKSKPKQVLQAGKERVYDATRSGLLLNFLNSDAAHLRSADFCLTALQFRYQRLMHTLASRLMRKMKKHMKKDNTSSNGVFDAFNECQVHLVTLARAYCDYIILKQFDAKIEEMAAKHGQDHAITSNLRLLFALHALDKISADPFFLERNVISPAKHKSIAKQVDKLVKELVPVLPALVDSFGLPELFFDQTIATTRADHYTSLFKHGNK